MGLGHFLFVFVILNCINTFVNSEQQFDFILLRIKNGTHTCINEDIYNHKELEKCMMVMPNENVNVAPPLTVLCMSLYDSFLRLCEEEKQNVKLKEKIPQNLIQFSNLVESQIDQKVSKFCTKVKENGNLASHDKTSSKTAPWFHFFTSSITDENKCERICSTADGVMLESLCSLIIWATELNSGSRNIADGPVQTTAHKYEDTPKNNDSSGKSSAIAVGENTNKVDIKPQPEKDKKVGPKPNSEPQPNIEVTVGPSAGNNNAVPSDTDGEVIAPPRDMSDAVRPNILDDGAATSTVKSGVAFHEGVEQLAPLRDSIKEAKEPESSPKQDGKQPVDNSAIKNQKTTKPKNNEATKLTKSESQKSSNSKSEVSPVNDVEDNTNNTPAPPNQMNPSADNNDNIDKDNDDGGDLLSKEEENNGNGEFVLEPNGAAEEGSDDEQIPSSVKESPPVPVENKQQKFNEPAAHVGVNSIAETDVTGELIVRNDPFVEAEESHFFTYFVSMAVLSIIVYLVFHNKKKLVALAVEGRRTRTTTRRRPNTASYSKLDCNLEEAMVSNTTASVTHVLY